MTDPITAAQTQTIEPVRTRKEAQQQGPWTRRLVLFLRIMAVLSMLKGLFHWSVVLGIGEGPDTQFASNPVPWQTATVYFAIIDLVAAVGLWLAAVWGAVVWLTAAVSMAAVEAFFPQIYGGSVVVVAVELALLCCYLFLAMQSAREHPH
jgi:fatty acid desaturase